MTNGGIHIDLISREKLAEMTPEERIRFIVDEIKAGKVLVLERGLTAKEELELIRVTMAEIDHESFIGVETPGFSIDLKKQGLFSKLLGRKPPPRMMVVGPAHMLRTIKKDGEMVQAMIVTKESMGEISMDQLPPPPKDWHPIPPPPATTEEGLGEEGGMPEEPGGQEENPEGGDTGEATDVSSEVVEGEEEKAMSPDRDEAGGSEEETEPEEEATEEEPEAQEEAAEEEPEPVEEGPKEEAGGGEEVPKDDTPEEEPKEVSQEALPEEPQSGEEEPPKKGGRGKQKKKYVSLTKYPEEPEEGGTEEPKEDEKNEGD